MRRMHVFLIAAVLLAASPVISAASGEGEDPGVTFGFEIEGVPCGGEFSGVSLDDVNLHVRVFIETDRARVQTWSVSIAAEGPGLKIFTMTAADAEPCAERCDQPCDNACMSRFIFGPDADPQSVFFMNHSSADPLGNSNNGPLAGMGPQGSGYVGAFTLDARTVPRLLPPGRVTVLRMPIEVTIPEDPRGAELRFRFRDGMTHEGGYNANYNLAIDSLGEVPLHLTECSITVRPTFPRMLPGDADASGELDISDPLAILMNLFVLVVEELPCGDADSSHPANRALLDFSGDGVLDITDPIVALQHIYLGGPPHALGRECRVFQMCPDVCGPDA